MPRPKAICLEDLSPDAGTERYLQCCARVGGEPGLKLGADGRVLWREDASGCELSVSGDDRLIAFRTQGDPPLRVFRAGRCVVVPDGKPAVLLDQDELEIGGRRLRLHLHGNAVAEQAPRPLREPPPKPPSASGEQPPLEVRPLPPRVAAPRPPAPAPPNPKPEAPRKKWWKLWK